MNRPFHARRHRWPRGLLVVLLWSLGGCGRVMKAAVDLPFHVAQTVAVESVKLPLRTAHMASRAAVDVTAGTVKKALK